MSSKRARQPSTSSWQIFRLLFRLRRIAAGGASRLKAHDLVLPPRNLAFSFGGVVEKHLAFRCGGWLFMLAHILSELSCDFRRGLEDAFFGQPETPRTKSLNSKATSAQSL